MNYGFGKKYMEINVQDFPRADKNAPIVAITSAESPRSPLYRSPKGMKTPVHHTDIDTSALIDAHIPEPLHSLDDVDGKLARAGILSPVNEQQFHMQNIGSNEANTTKNSANPFN